MKNNYFIRTMAAFISCIIMISAVPTNAGTRDFGTSPTIATGANDNEYRTETLRLMSVTDYCDLSMSGTSAGNSGLTLEEVNKRLSGYGRFLHSGMPVNEYMEAMDYIWEDCTEKKNEYKRKDLKTYLRTDIVCTLKTELISV